MEITSDLFTTLFPATKPADLWKTPKSTGTHDLVDSLLEDVQRVQDTFLQIRLGSLKLYKNNQEVSSSVDYTHYLQLGNFTVKKLAQSIVSARDSDDVKAGKLRDWVQENITYADDFKTYGQSEYWALPSMTLRREQGDCEDGAFLLASMMLAVGVDTDRVRVYGGFVSDGTIEATGGHAWVAYKRETDEEWVALDWCYYPTDDSVQERQTLAQDQRYMDDYFFVEATRTVETPYTNTLRLPAGYKRALAQAPGQMLQALA
jgi:transglutaminase-like putative cysteine protease